ncbi:hypothetical protein [uncultured Cardiobacterium sp.]|uniref:hypothetical protein n=1 Tax=uncultured Cardiobacterium sp. TaxID=417619 RepID=UPI002615DBEC|nr:hypothetical protein [uncultured Cardiobacterium sp.]
MNTSTVERESRTAKPVLVKITKTDRKRLQRAARDHKIPMSTIAYQCIKRWLDAEYGEGGVR